MWTSAFQVHFKTQESISMRQVSPLGSGTKLFTFYWVNVCLSVQVYVGSLAAHATTHHVQLANQFSEPEIDYSQLDENET